MQMCRAKNNVQTVPTIAWKRKLLSSHLKKDKIKKIVMQISTNIFEVLFFTVPCS